jgi:prepilin-type processing-associated H-X9-DG protein
MTTWGKGTAMFCVARHGRAVNIVFLDGHARRVELEELWKLHWSNEYTPTDVVLPPR